MPTDHRTIVAAQRREKMRRRLIEAATLVIAAKGPDAIVIDDIIAEAGVSRGTFYKYYDTVVEILAEAKQTLGDEMYQLVLDAQSPQEDVAQVIALDMLRFIATCMRYPLMGQFSAQLGFQGLGRGNLIHKIGPAMLSHGAKTGCFAAMPQNMAIDLLQLGVIALLKRHAEGEEVDPRDMVAALLRLLGVAPDQAALAAAQDYAALTAPPDSLIARSDRIRQCAKALPNPA